MDDKEQSKEESKEEPIEDSNRPSNPGDILKKGKDTKTWEKRLGIEDH